MRAFLLTAALLLAGCQSEGTARNQQRDGDIRSCVEEIRRSPEGRSLAGRIDLERVCACTIDRISAGSGSDVPRADDGRPTPAARAQAQRCMLDALGAPGSTAGAAR